MEKRDYTIEKRLDIALRAAQAMEGIMGRLVADLKRQRSQDMIATQSMAQLAQQYSAMTAQSLRKAAQRLPKVKPEKRTPPPGPNTGTMAGPTS